VFVINNTKIIYFFEVSFKIIINDFGGIIGLIGFDVFVVLIFVGVVV
jgi:hypothetical protein